MAEVGELSHSGSSDGAEISEIYTWQGWDPDSGYRFLARYVATADALDGLGLSVGKELHPERQAAELDRERAQRLYELLLEKDLEYTEDKRFLGRWTQYVRTPAELLAAGQGTCLDIATTYATMCVAGYVDVMLGIAGSHVFVVAVPGRAHGGAYKSVLEVPGFVSSREEGVISKNFAALVAAEDDGLLLSIDATECAAGSSFEKACAYVRNQKNQDQTVHLVDVAFLQETHKVPALGRPFGPTIHSYVPSGAVEFREYEGDKPLIKSLNGDPRSLILCGPPGQGKSMIARHLAEDRPAWFLDASEPQALINSLASARLNEKEESRDKPEKIEREALAFEALARLRSAEDDWLVVLDNANGDPTKLRKLIPPHRPGHRVLVTTTNPEWASHDFELIELHDVERGNLDELGNAKLDDLVRGRRLMLEALRRLLERTEWTAETLAVLADDLGVEDEEMRGPVTFWEALRQSEGFGERELRLSAFASYLPPDYQPVPLFQALLGPEAEPALALLEDRSLLARDRETERVRMHRLFGAAVRQYLDAERPGLRNEVVRELAAREDSQKVFDQHGDLETVVRLDDRLAEIDTETDAPDLQLGDALHGVGGLLERLGQTRRSGATFELAQKYVEEPQKIADCLQGRARPINQHHKREEGLLRQAVEWTKEARQIVFEAEEDKERAKARAGRCLAMEGLLTRALSQFPGKGETTLGILHHAFDLLTEADDLRRNKPDIEEDEEARSRFNLGGVRIGLAKAEPEKAETYLKEAEDTYDEVLAWRKELYKCDIHPHIAACEAGLGYVAYYRAVLLPASPQQRSEWLRSATDHTVAALKQWETLDGSVDIDEAPKSAAFLAKVALARHSMPAAADSRPEAVFAEAIKELTPPRIVLRTIPPLPSDRGKVKKAIVAWAGSPALAELVRLEGAELPEGLEVSDLLAWLDEFSQRWDDGANDQSVLAGRSIDAVSEKIVTAAFSALGFVKGGAKPKDRYDHVLILGGAAAPAIAHPLYVANLISRKKDAIETPSVIAIAPSGEMEALEAGVRQAFALEAGAEAQIADTGSWSVRDYQGEGGLRIRIAAMAPGGDSPRSTWADLLERVSPELVQLRPEERLLVVASEVHAPVQHAEALRLLGLPNEAEVETAAVRASDVDPRLPGQPNRRAHLQEVRSTIVALRRLLAAGN